MKTNPRAWRKVAIALTGGGCRGVTQPPRLLVLMEFLHEHGIPVSDLFTKSVGTFNGFGFAADPTPDGVRRIMHIWREYCNAPSKIYTPSLTRFYFKEGYCFLKWLVTKKQDENYLDLSPLLSTLRREIDIEKAIHSPIHWHISTEEFLSRRKVFFSNRALQQQDPDTAKRLLIEYMRASAALELVFKPVEIQYPDGRVVLCCDGDVADPASISDALDAGCDAVFALLTIPTTRRMPEENVNLLKRAVRLKNRLDGANLEKQIKDAQRRAKAEGTDIFVSQPAQTHPKLGLLNISPEAIAFHEHEEIVTMQDFLQNLDAHNLRYMDDIE